MNERARLLVRVAAKLAGAANDADRTKLLRWADELLSARPDEAGVPVAPAVASTARGLRLPMAIHKVFKGQRYEAQLLPGWRVKYGNEVFPSVSAAAIAITGTNQNGWRFWRYLEPPTGEERSIARLRNTTGVTLAEAMAGDADFVEGARRGLAALDKGEVFRLRSRSG